MVCPAFAGAHLLGKLENGQQVVRNFEVSS